MAAIYLHPSKEATIRRGHPWIFPKAIAKVQGKPENGSLVSILGQQEELLGIGVYNEHSLYRVRVLSRPPEVFTTNDFASLIHYRIKQAHTLRQSLGLPNSENNAFRLFNSEADGLSGLTIDYFNGVCVVSSSAYWVEKQKTFIISALQDVMSDCRVIWLSQQKPLSQDGWQLSETTPVDELEVEIVEAGVRYQIRFAHTQKTGLFLDQRENHHRLAAFTRNKRVLDLYTYTGGFALHAAKAGAAAVTAVDSSAAAIEQARNNASLNELNIEFIHADARDYLSKAGDYDVIILDPPKLVPSQQHLNRAKNYYRFLHREVFKAMKSGSLLMTCNCSSALSSEAFAQLVITQAEMVGKQARLLSVNGPAVCHPTLPVFPEGNYLTALLLAVV